MDLVSLLKLDPEFQNYILKDTLLRADLSTQVLVSTVIVTIKLSQFDL